MFKIVIPTYDRSDRFETLAFLGRNNIPVQNIYIFVASEEERQKYINSFGNEYNFIIGVEGLVNQRNFISNYFDEGEILISMDDDIEDIIHKNDEPLIKWLDECVNFLNNSECGLLSINPSGSKLYFQQRNDYVPFKIKKYYCVGAFYIFKNDRQLKLNNKIILEDIERSLLYIKKYNSNIRYNDVLLKTKYFGKGGLSSQRNKNNYLNSTNILLNDYSEYLYYNYKKLPLDKNILFANLRIRKNITPNNGIVVLPKINPSELFELYNMLDNLYIAKKNKNTNRRGFPLGHQATTFGFTRGRFHGRYELGMMSKKYPEIYNELLRIGNIFCPFEFTSIHINKNVVCPHHKDSQNTGKSMLLSFGEYTGCKIVINVEGIETEFDANCQPIIFDGSALEHWNTNDLHGTKYSLVFFNNSKQSNRKV
jgi:hypothetical protein